MESLHAESKCASRWCQAGIDSSSNGAEVIEEIEWRLCLFAVVTIVEHNSQDASSNFDCKHKFTAVRRFYEWACGQRLWMGQSATRSVLSLNEAVMEDAPLKVMCTIYLVTCANVLLQTTVLSPRRLPQYLASKTQFELWSLRCHPLSLKICGLINFVRSRANMVKK